MKIYQLFLLITLCIVLVACGGSEKVTEKTNSELLEDKMNVVVKGTLLNARTDKIISDHEIIIYFNPGTSVSTKSGEFEYVANDPGTYKVRFEQVIDKRKEVLGETEMTLSLKPEGTYNSRLVKLFLFEQSTINDSLSVMGKDNNVNVEPTVIHLD